MKTNSALELELYPTGFPEFITDAGGLKRWFEKDETRPWGSDWVEEDIRTWDDEDYNELLTFLVMRRTQNKICIQDLFDEEDLHFLVYDLESYKDGTLDELDAEAEEQDKYEKCRAPSTVPLAARLASMLCDSSDED
jgi:hypothetical protein